MPDHLERGRPRADHNARLEGDRGYTGCHQNLADLLARLQVQGEIIALRMQPSQVDDARDSSLRRSLGHSLCGLQFDLLKVTLGTHRVHEVVGDILPLARLGDSLGVGQVALNDGHESCPRNIDEFLRRAHEHGDFVPCCE